MSEFQHTYNLSKVNCNTEENFNSLIKSKEIKPKIKIILSKKSPGSPGFTDEFD
jgi:hypothetical protein